MIRTVLQKILQPLSEYENGKIVIIPGDRDWADSKKGGLQNVKKLEKLIKGFKYENVRWAIKNGCPGPVLIKLTPDIFLAAINTQWWNHPHDKPRPADADCKISTTNDFKEELEEVEELVEEEEFVVAVAIVEERLDPIIEKLLMYCPLPTPTPLPITPLLLQLLLLPLPFQSINH